MQELEFAFMLEFWYDVFLRLHEVNEALQEEKMNLKYVRI